MAEAYVKVSEPAAPETEMTEAKKSPKAALETKESGLLKPEEKGINRTTSSLNPGLNKQKSKPPQKNNKEDLDAQTKAFSDPASLFSCAYAADAEKIYAAVEKDGWEILQQVGPVGDSPFLVLFLIHSPAHLAIAQKCITQYNEELIYTQYQGQFSEDGHPRYPLYWGETALHLAVVNRNEALLDFLLGTQKKLHAAGRCLNLDLLTMAAKGTFFAPPLDKGPCYYGEVPLGFAACTANQKMCDKLLHEHGADLQFEDSYGNNLLHLLALHNLPKMFSYVLDEEKKSEKSKIPGYVPLASRKNKEGLTPLALAAQSGNKEAFGTLVDASKVTVWTYGPIEMIKFPLHEIDTLDLVEIHSYKYPSENKDKEKDKDKDKEKEKEDRVGIIELLIREGHIELLMQNVLIDVLDNKWTRYAFRRYLMRCLKQSVLVFSLTLSLIMGYPDPCNYSFDEDTAVNSGFRILFELIVVYMIVLKGFSEAGEMYNAGVKDYYGDVGVAFLENLLSSSYCMTILVVVIIRIIGIVTRLHYLTTEGADGEHLGTGTEYTDSDTDTTVIELPSMTAHADIFFQCIAVLLIYLYAITLLLGFRLTGQFVIMISKMLKNDVARFCLVFVVLWLGFGTALLALESVPLVDPASGWAVFYTNLSQLFQMMLGNGDFNVIYPLLANDWSGFFQILGGGLVITYSILITVMLLNLLIAMMGDTYGIVKESTEMEYVQYKAQIIMSLENEMSPSDWKNINPYWIMDAGKPWLQIQIKNRTFLEMNQNASLLPPEPPQPVISDAKKFETADLNNDGKIDADELKDYEAKIREQLREEIIRQLMREGRLAAPQRSPGDDGFVKVADLAPGEGLKRDGVYEVGN